MQILSNEPPPKHEKEQMLLYQPTKNNICIIWKCIKKKDLSTSQNVAYNGEIVNPAIKYKTNQQTNATKNQFVLMKITNKKPTTN